MDQIVLFSLGLALGGMLGAAVMSRLAARRQDRERARSRAEQEALRQEFRSVSAEALRASQEQFLDLAQERLRRSEQEGGAALARREQAVREMVEPLSRSIETMRAQTVEADRARAAGQAALGEQVRQMMAATERVGRKADDFINTLRRSDVRGNWGEVQLRRVVELAGMVEHVDFTEQEVVRDGEGRNLRPDMTVRLAGGRSIVVDSKVALVALLEAFETEDDAVRAERLQAHARHVRRHVDDLSAKRYWEQFASAPEFVVMFVPSEAFYQAALEQDGSLQEYAYRKGVVIATPTTLVAMLRTVAHAWREEALARDAQQVLALGKELYERLSTLASHLGKVGKAIDQAGRAYNSTVASLESRVLVSARRFGEMQRLSDELPEVEQITTDARELTAPELVSGAPGSPQEPAARD
ncbi:DNA recombination protein RmuC [Demequina lignilytica]|uniref:DNA recombination protein RmuC n=1 Tax=Demequina lignilytica TaxID=3051663 RepID=A0AB35MIX4_9MICO|nr:DNA recombination protein RmuC [Demequina sp. SYSU T0a273]MDN4483682.1 DNA recombination protein RmuC [Demequina sp. SYSU T0a273]